MKILKTGAALIAALVISACGSQNDSQPLRVIEGQIIVEPQKSLKLNSAISGSALDVISGRAQLLIYTNRVELQNSHGTFLFKYPEDALERSSSLMTLTNLSSAPTMLIDGYSVLQPVNVYGSKEIKNKTERELETLETKYLGSTSEFSHFIQVGDVMVPQFDTKHHYQQRQVIAKEAVTTSRYSVEFKDLKDESVLGHFIAETRETNSTVIKILSDWK